MPVVARVPQQCLLLVSICLSCTALPMQHLMQSEVVSLGRLAIEIHMNVSCTGSAHCNTFACRCYLFLAALGTMPVSPREVQICALGARCTSSKRAHACCQKRINTAVQPGKKITTPAPRRVRLLKNKSHNQVPSYAHHLHRGTQRALLYIILLPVSYTHLTLPTTPYV